MICSANLEDWHKVVKTLVCLAVDLEVWIRETGALISHVLLVRHLMAMHKIILCFAVEVDLLSTCPLNALS